MKYLLTVSLFLLSNLVLAQQNDEGPNFKTFTKDKTYNTTTARKHLSELAIKHPDFGILPAGELEGYFEDPSKRTEDTRYFINEEDPSTIYLSKSSVPFNYKEGIFWRAMDTKVRPYPNGVFAARHQASPIVIDTQNKKVDFMGGTTPISLNQLQLKVAYKDGSVAVLAPDWSSFTAGDNGMYVHDIFPKMDLQIEVRAGELETTYILQEKPASVVKMWVLDQMDLGDNGLTMHKNIDETAILDQLPAIEAEYGAEAVTEVMNWLNSAYYGNILIGKTPQNPSYIIQPVYVYDASGNEESFSLPYELNTDKNQLAVVIDETLLENTDLVYPVYIDPTVTYGPAQSNTKMGAKNYPDYCSQDLSLTIPGGVTPLDVAVDWDVEIGFQCGRVFHDKGNNAKITDRTGKRSDAAIWVENSCGSAPSSGYWECETGDCGASASATLYEEVIMDLLIISGTSTIYPKDAASEFWSSGYGFGETPHTQNLINCVSPMCSNQNLGLTIKVSNLDATNNVDCGCEETSSRYQEKKVTEKIFGIPFTVTFKYYYVNVPEVRLNSWSFKVLAKKFDLLTDAQNIVIPVSCTGGTTETFDPLPDGGIDDNYTFAWSTGATTPTITVPTWENNGETFTVNVKDECGVTRVAAFEVNCPLAVSFEEFYVENLAREVLLDWTTATETDNQYFEIYRSSNGKDFELIDTVTGAGTSNQAIHYSYLDKNPLLGVSYYKLGMVDVNGEREFTGIKSVQRVGNGTAAIRLVPNPASNMVSVGYEFPSEGKYLIKIVDNLGRTQFQVEKVFQEGTQTVDVNTRDFAAGAYTVIVYTKNTATTTQLIIRK